MLPGCLGADVATATGLTVVAEGFADRAYTDDGRLVPRDQPGAVLHDPSAVASHAAGLAQTGRVSSLCIHGDTPGALKAALAVRRALIQHGFALAPFGDR